MDEITKFLATVSQLQKLRSQIDTARNLPDNFEAQGKAFRVVDYEYGQAQGITKDAIKRVCELVRIEFREKGESARREALAALAIELDVLRTALPSLASKAAIEFGVIARQVEKESRT